MEIQKIFSDLDGDERLYSVLMNEEELSLCTSLFSKEDEDDDDLNISDSINKTLAKNPLTIKWLREIEKNNLSMDPEKNKKARRDAAKLGAGLGSAAGLTGGILVGRKHGAKMGAKAAGAGLAGAAVGTGGGYLGSKIGQALRRRIRKSGGGGAYDDKFARRADLLAVADGEMSKKEFKNKWYRNNSSRG